MEKYLEYEKEYLLEKKAFNTAKEIEQQPRLWIETMDILRNRKSEIKDFLSKIDFKNTKVIFTGAGTSEFVGSALAPYLREIKSYDMESRATTDIVGNPEAYIPVDKEILLVSFARSGNSPESVAAVEIANKVSNNIKHLVITCNKNGRLANMKLENSLVLHMPEDSNDLGFAMTGSFSCMMLGAYCVFRLEDFNEIESDIKKISKQVESNVSSFKEVIEKIIKLDTERVVYLGGSGLKGIAQELSLKLLELCAGKIPAIYDSPLGFRHGPKSIVNNKTIVFNLLSNNDYSKKYDYDLINELVKDNKANVITFSSNNEFSPKGFSINTNIFSKDPILTALSYLIPGQMYAFMKSLEQGITPDNPCPTGEVNRVVQGVVIHQYEK